MSPNVCPGAAAALQRRPTAPSRLCCKISAGKTASTLMILGAVKTKIISVFLPKCVKNHHSPSLWSRLRWNVQLYIQEKNKHPAQAPDLLHMAE